MGRVNIVSMVVVKSAVHDYVITPSTPQELATLALNLLVEEQGTEGARLFLRKAFSEYRRDYRGLGRDSGPAKLDAIDPRQSAYRYGPSQD